MKAARDFLLQWSGVLVFLSVAGVGACLLIRWALTGRT